MAALTARLFSISEKSWQHGEPTGISSTPAMLAYYSSLAEVANEKGWLGFHILSVGGRDVAFEYRFLFEGVVYCLKRGFDSAFAKSSPGRVLRRYVLEQTFRSGASEFNMLGIADSFKMAWTRTTRKHCKWLIFNRNLYGRMLYGMRTRVWDPLKQRLAARRGDTQSQPNAIDQ